MLPKEILNKIENFEQSRNDVIASAHNINYKYHNESGQNKVLVSTQLESLAYSVYRMPATYEVCLNVFKQLYNIVGNTHFLSLLDVGSGTGSATLACSQVFAFDKIVCFERETSMINCAKNLISEYVDNVQWQQGSLGTYNFNNKYDMVVSSYVLNEMDDNTRIKIVDQLWQCTNNILVIIEPGTQEGFRQIQSIRNYLIDKNANIVTPCTHNQQCKMSDNGLCQFSCRVPRTKLLKQIKNADVPYEDEKFCYIVFSKQKYQLPQYRVIKHPFYRPKVVEMTVCGKDELKNLVITKNQKELYKIARDCKVGDYINIDK